MPGKITKLDSGKYRVIWDGKITAYGTTRTKAESQLRLLEMLEYRAHPGYVMQEKRKAERKVKRAKRAGIPKKVNSKKGR